MLNSLKILFIDDDAIEVMKFHRVISALGLTHHVIEANNGEAALSFLKDGESLPDIMLLDLNMPKLNGMEFLNIIKSDPVLKHIPIIILTTSNNFKDLKECYKIGIAGYVLKPLKYEDYISKIHKILDYWSCNELISE